MKKSILWTVCISLVVLATYWIFPKSGSHSELDFEVGSSDIFSEAEIKSAMEVVQNQFGFPNTTLRKLSYDEEKSKSRLGGQENTKNASNALIIFSEFYVDGTGENPVLTPDTVYENYMWILVRESDKAPWVIEDQGY